jgi:hypothetical protein
MYLGLQTQLELAQHDYDSQVAAQHEFAIRQMMANQRDEQQKNAIALGKVVGGGDILADPGNPLGASLSSNPGVLTNLAQAQRNEQGAKDFQATMTGLNQGSQGGYQLAPGSAVPPGLPPGLNLTNLGPAIVQGDKIKAAASMANAAIGAGGKGPGYSENYQYPAIPLAGGGELITGGSATKLKTDADRAAARQIALDRANEIMRDRSGGGATGLTPPAGLNGVLPPAQQDTGTPAGDNTPLGQVTKAPGVANTPTAKQPATSAQPSGAYNTIDTNSPLGKAAQNEAKKLQDRAKREAEANVPGAKAAYEDISAGMKGGAFTILMKPDGGIYVQGASPKSSYFLGNPQGAKQ